MLCRKAAMHFPLYSEAARGQRVAQANHSVISCVMLDCNSELLKPFCFVMLWPLFQSLARRLPMVLYAKTKFHILAFYSRHPLPMFVSPLISKVQLGTSCLKKSPDILNQTLVNRSPGNHICSLRGVPETTNFRCGDRSVRPLPHSAPRENGHSRH